MRLGFFPAARVSWLLATCTAVPAMVVCSAWALGPTASNASPWPTRPLAWPLGPDGSIARALFSTHGQLWQWSYGGSSGTYVHQGIDISACAREPVFAVEEGTVVFSNFRDPTVAKEYMELIVSRGSDLSRGIRYLHLGATTVTIGDTVARDQLLGTVANWLAPCSYDHLHLQVVRVNDSTWNPGDPWPASAAADDANPLSVFDPAADKQPPYCHQVPSSITTHLTDVLFFRDGTDTELDPGALSGSIDVVASMHDLCFDGTAASSSGCSETSSKEVAPLSVSMTITDTTPGGSGASPPAFAPVLFAEAISAESIEHLAKFRYHASSVASYGERDLRFTLTSSDSSGDAWTPPPGTYEIEIVAKDRGGNEVTLAATKVTVSGP